MRAFLRRIARALLEGGVELDVARLPHGAMTGAGDGSGRLYSVFAPPLLRVDRWIWWLWQRIRGRKALGSITMTSRNRRVFNPSTGLVHAVEIKRKVRVVESGLAVPNVPSAGATIIQPMTPEESRAMDELAKKDFGFRPNRKPRAVN